MSTTTAEAPRPILTWAQETANEQNPDYIQTVYIDHQNGDMCQYGRTHEGKFTFLGVVSTVQTRKISDLKRALKLLEGDQELEQDKQERLQAIEALRVLVARN